MQIYTGFKIRNFREKIYWRILVDANLYRSSNWKVLGLNLQTYFQLSSFKAKFTDVFDFVEIYTGFKIEKR